MITLKINGNRLRLFDSFGYSVQIDTISDSLSFNSFEDIEAFDYANIEAYRNGILIFTGEIVEKSVPNETPIKPFNYKALSKPHILEECTLPTEAYPLQLENSTLRDIVEFICSYYSVIVVFDQSAETEASSGYKLSDLRLGDVAGGIINDLVTNESLVLTSDSYGRLIITKEIMQSEILLPRHTSDKKSYDLRKFFHNYIALGQAPIGEDADIQVIARFDNIDSRRSITKIQDSGGIETIEKKAEGMRLDSLKHIRQNLNFNNFFCNIGDFVFIDNYKLVVNQLNYSYNATGESCGISLIDSKIYER